MILTVCLSPCVDVNIEVDSLRIGRQNKIISKRIIFTGKALNVATGISRLQADVFATGFMYDGNGNQFEHELHRERVPYKFVWCEGRVRENYKFIDNRSMLTEVDDLSPQVSDEKQQELIDLVAGLAQGSEAIVISGGIAKGMSPSYYASVLKATPKGVKRIIDCEGERLFESLKVGVDLVKPNLEELESTLKRQMRSKEELLEGCHKLVDMGAANVLLSLGKKGAIITNGSKNYYCKSLNVAMNSTIGAGDGMVAGATLALTKSADLSEILRCGVAAGTASVTSAFSVSFEKEKYEEILSNLSVKEI